MVPEEAALFGQGCLWGDGFREVLSETLFSELGLAPGESKRIGSFILTALRASRSVPAIVSVAGEEAAA